MYCSHLMLKFSTLGIAWEAASILWHFVNIEGCVTFFFFPPPNKAITVSCLFSAEPLQGFSVSGMSHKLCVYEYTGKIAFNG